VLICPREDFAREWLPNAIRIATTFFVRIGPKFFGDLVRFTSRKADALRIIESFAQILCSNAHGSRNGLASPIGDARRGGSS